MKSVEQIRVELARADDDGRRAWEAAAGLGRRIANAQGQSGALEIALEMMDTELASVEHALRRLRAVHDELSRHRGREPKTPAASAPAACPRCGRTDAIVPITICVRCSGAGQA